MSSGGTGAIPTPVYPLYSPPRVPPSDGAATCICTPPGKPVQFRFARQRKTRPFRSGSFVCLLWMSYLFSAILIVFEKLRPLSSPTMFTMARYWPLGSDDASNV